jgi:hypothetical protein
MKIGGTLQMIDAEILGAIAEPDIDITQLKEDDEGLMQAVLNHDRVLTQLFAQIPLLPLRFGTQFAHIQAVQQHLLEHHQTYAERLAHLTDKAEYLLKLSPKPPELPGLSEELKGRAYFLAKKERLQAQSQRQQQQDEEFAALMEALTAAPFPWIQIPPNAGEERLNLLLARNNAIAQTQIVPLLARLTTWDVFMSEPLPPYHFAM